MNKIIISDDGYGDKDYLEWIRGSWEHFYTTSLASPHYKTDLTDEDRKIILEAFGLKNDQIALSSIDFRSPDDLQLLVSTVKPI